MARLLINIGTVPNDFTGDPLRVAFDKINQNFEELYDEIGSSLLTADELAAINNSTLPSAANPFATLNDISNFISLAELDGNKGDITVSSGGTSWLINNASVDDAHITGVAWSKVTGVPVFAGSTPGLVPASLGGTSNFLRADGSWAQPPSTSAVTASNLLTKVGNDIQLGGNSTGNTILNLVDGHDFKIVDGDYQMGIGSATFFLGGLHMSWGDITSRVGQYADAYIDPAGFVVDSQAADGTGITLFLRNNIVTFSDNRTVKRGIEYGGAGYVSQLHSLTDKEYVDGKFNSIPVFTGSTAGLVPVSVGGSTNFLRADGVWSAPATTLAANGLTKTGSTIKLGGTIDEPTSVTFPAGDNFEMIKGTGATSAGFYNSADYTYNGWHFAYGDFVARTTSYSDLWVDQNGFGFESQNGTGEINLFRMSPSSVLFTDGRNAKRGIEYAADGYVTQLHSLTTKKYVDDAIAAIGATGVADGDKGDITVSLGGTSWVVDAGAITNTKIADSAITATKIINNGVTSAKIQSLNWSKLDFIPAMVSSLGALTDPNADRLLFWDESVGAVGWLTLGTNLSIVGTTISASSGVGSGQTYTPTILSSSNVASHTMFAASYIKVGDVYFISGQINIDATALGNVNVVISLPDALDEATNVRGVATVIGGTTNSVGYAGLNAIHDAPSITYLATEGGIMNLHFMLMVTFI